MFNSGERVHLFCSFTKTQKNENFQHCNTHEFYNQAKSMSSIPIWDKF